MIPSIGREIVFWLKLSCSKVPSGPGLWPLGPEALSLASFPAWNLFEVMFLLDHVFGDEEIVDKKKDKLLDLQFDPDIIPWVEEELAKFLYILLVKPSICPEQFNTACGITTASLCPHGSSDAAAATSQRGSCTAAMPHASVDRFLRYNTVQSVASIRLHGPSNASSMD